MNLSDRIDAFNKLSQYLLKDIYKDNRILIRKIQLINPWFTSTNIRLALQYWQINLDSHNVSKWINRYNVSEGLCKTVLLVMPGNIPMVGFHDLLSVLILGNKVIIKLSSNDNILIPLLINKLIEYEPRFKDKIIIADKFSDYKIDAVIVTGNNDTARYFRYYFRNIKKIIRNSRSSVAVLNGQESDKQLSALADDIFTYFGLGCRNVSKIFVPKGYKLVNLLDYFKRYESIYLHQKYINNYHHHRSLFLMQSIDFIDSSFFLMQESKSLFAPISVIYYEFYDHEINVEEFIDGNNLNLQCIIGNNNLPFGSAQFPKLWDYADNIDTVNFLEGV